MLQKKQQSELAEKTVRECIEALMDMMATFRTYSGRHLDIDRGDFDVEFFKELHGKCSAIHGKLQSLTRILGASKKPKKAPKSVLSRAIPARLSPAA